MPGQRCLESLKGAFSNSRRNIYLAGAVVNTVHLLCIGTDYKQRLLLIFWRNISPKIATICPIVVWKEDIPKLAVVLFDFQLTPTGKLRSATVHELKRVYGLVGNADAGENE